MAHELFRASWVAYTDLPYDAIDGTALARTTLLLDYGHGPFSYSNDCFTCINTPVREAVDYLTTRIYAEETIRGIPFGDLPPLLEATDEEMEEFEREADEDMEEMMADPGYRAWVDDMLASLEADETHPANHY